MPALYRNDETFGVVLGDGQTFFNVGMPSDINPERALQFYLRPGDREPGVRPFEEDEREKLEELLAATPPYLTIAFTDVRSIDAMIYALNRLRNIDDQNFEVWTLSADVEEQDPPNDNP